MVIPLLRSILHAKKKGLTVALVEKGRSFDKRECIADKGAMCVGCAPCNVISGFGGCVHFGDSAKLSYYPSGKELYDKLADDYWLFLNEALSFWRVEKKDFIENDIPSIGENQEVKVFPVRVTTSEEIKSFMEEKWEDVIGSGVEYFNYEMVDFSDGVKGLKICLDSGDTIKAKKVVLAMGRFGMKWLNNNLQAKKFEYETPIPTVGFRFEMPKEYLEPLGKIHPDFKLRMVYNGYKYKTFCYCGGSHGGRLKFANYGEYTLLDGHILTEDDINSNYGNFTVLRQLTDVKGDRKAAIENEKAILSKYIEKYAGKPMYQSYKNFRKAVYEGESLGISAINVKSGPVHDLIDMGLEDYCHVVEEAISYVAKYAKCSADEIIEHTSVIGLELEGLWNRISTDDHFMIKGREIYVGGDCRGGAQGILQATIEGIAIANYL